MLQQQLAAVQGNGAMRLAIKAPPHPTPTLNPKLQRFQSAAVGLNRSIGVRCRMAEPSGKPAPMGQKSFYQDSWTDNFLLGLCVRRIGKINGKSNIYCTPHAHVWKKNPKKQSSSLNW